MKYKNLSSMRFIYKGDILKDKKLVAEKNERIVKARKPKNIKAPKDEKAKKTSKITLKVRFLGGVG